jgi:peptidoglycan L-alanyl-D-glutamate endopeptidase CwlK
MTCALGSTSLKRLEGLAPSLAAVVQRAIQLTTQDFTVVEGVRSKEQMCVNYGKGRTASECEAKEMPGSYARPDLAKVTWLSDPYASKHGVQADGFGHAVDLAPWVDGAIDWNTTARFEAIADSMSAAAAELGVTVNWGGDWTTSVDMPHFELP